MCEVQVEINLRKKVKYSFHWIDFYEIKNELLNFYLPYLYLIFSNSDEIVDSTSKMLLRP